MTRTILPFLIFIFAPLTHAFIATGDQIICSGFANQFQFKIGEQITDSNNQSIQPTQFRGSFENLKPGESQSGTALFIEISPDQFAVEMLTELPTNLPTKSVTIGYLEDYGQLAFSRIIREGSKHLTNCYFREL